MSQAYKQCPQCSQNAALHVPACLRCGHQYRTVFSPPEQTQAFYPQTASYYPHNFPGTADAPANIPLICGMLALNVVSGALWLISIPISLIVDLAAIGCGIQLIRSKNRTDRIWGWLKISLELAGFAYFFIAAYNAAHNPLPIDSEFGH